MHAVGEHRERATRPRAGVTHLDDAVGLREVVHLTNHQQARCQLETIARAEMLAGGLVGDFREAADELLVDVAHIGVAH